MPQRAHEGQRHQFDMASARLSGILIAFWLCAVLRPQAPPAFEAASLKLSPDAPGSVVGIFETKGRISAKNVTLRRCVRGAYEVPESQIFGGPKWVDEDRYYIEAKAGGLAGDHALMLMLRGTDTQGIHFETDCHSPLSKM